MQPRLIAFVLFLLVFATAQAHTKLLESMPANKASVDVPPKALVLHFSEAVHITALSLQKDSAQPQPLEASNTAAAAQVTVPLPALSRGKYVVNWRVVGKDNHIVSGALEFTVQ